MHGWERGCEPMGSVANNAPQPVSPPAACRPHSVQLSSQSCWANAHVADMMAVIMQRLSGGRPGI